MNIYKIAGYAFFLGLILSVIIFGGSIRAFVDYPSILIVAGGAFGITLITNSILGSRLHVWKIASVAFILAALMGEGIGLIQMLHNLADPSSLGPSMAVGMLTSLYALILLAITSSQVDEEVMRTKSYETSNIGVVTIVYPFFMILAILLSFYILLYAIGSR